MTHQLERRAISAFGIAYLGQYYWDKAMEPLVGKSRNVIAETTIATGTTLIVFNPDWTILCKATLLRSVAGLLPHQEARLPSGKAPASPES